jgi:hypothetical protein
MAPIIVELGKKRGRVLKRLKRGRGRAADEVRQVLEEVQQQLGPEAENAEIVPIVLIYRRRTKRPPDGLAALARLL